MIPFIHNLGLFLLRFVSGTLIIYFSARELAARSNVFQETLQILQVPAADIAKVFIGCAALFMGVLLLIGFWSRIVALALLLALVVGSFSWPAQESFVHFQFQALYGVVFLYLALAGGGNWAISKPGGREKDAIFDTPHAPVTTWSSRPSIIPELDREKGDAGEEGDPEEEEEATESRK